MNTRKLDITTAADGTFSADIQTPGRIHAVSLVIGDLSTPDLSCTDLLTGASVLVDGAVGATTRYQPRIVGNLNTDGTGLADPNFVTPVVLNKMHVTIISGGDTKSGTLYVTHGA